MTSEVKNRKKTEGKPENAYKQAQFINHSFSPDDKRAFKEWCASPDVSLGGLLDYVAEQGYRVTVKYDDYSSAYAAFLQTSDIKNPNFGFILTGRGGSGSGALLGALYRHLVLFEGDWPTDVVRRNDLDDE